MLNSSWGYQAGDTVQLATLARGGLIESRHFGLAVLTDPKGKVVDQKGNSRKLIYPRSAVKPLQAVAVRRAGVVLEGAQLAISAGSHQGTREHIELVEQILAKLNLSKDDLACPMAWPGNLEARKFANSQSRLAFNCSGKHASFLLACVSNGWDKKDYLVLDHPLQRIIAEVIEEFASERIAHSTIDGCGAPLHALSLAGLARSIGRFAKEEIEIAKAMKSNGWAVGDRGATDSQLLDAGMIAKIGAEGVFVIGLESGHGVAIKVADGSQRPAALAALKMLANHGLLAEAEFEHWLEKLGTQSLGGEEVLGSLEVAF